MPPVLRLQESLVDIWTRELEHACVLATLRRHTNTTRTNMPQNDFWKGTCVDIYTSGNWACVCRNECVHVLGLTGVSNQKGP